MGETYEAKDPDGSSTPTKESYGIRTASEAFAQILQSVGDSNRWQNRFMLISGFCGLFTSLHNLGAVFLGATPAHWCKIPTLNATKEVSKEVQNLTVPWIQGKDGDLVHSSCSYYDRDYSELEDVSAELPSFLGEIKGGPKAPCSSWFYDSSLHSSTVVTEWDLVCDQRWMMSTIQASYMMGILAGAVIFSAISDRIGRKKSAMICVGLFFISALLTSFSVSFNMFLTLRFITAGSGQGLFLINFVILMECSGRKSRSTNGCMYHLFFGVGLSCLPLLAYIWPDWRTLQLASSIPICILLSYLWILPESPRWLLMHKKFDEGLIILKQIADYNGKCLPPEEELNSYLDVIHKEVSSKVPVKCSEKLVRVFQDMVTLVRTPNMRRRSLIIFYAWFVTSMLYYGLTFSSSNINASIYLTVMLAGIVEIPACAVSAYAVLKLGRRICLVITMILSGVACIGVVFVPKELVWAKLSLSTFGKMIMTVDFMLVFIYSAELVPTDVRNTSVGMASMVARIGSGIAPYIVDLLGDVYYAIPFVIFGVLALLSGALSFLLPETGKSDLPESIPEIEKLPK